MMEMHYFTKILWDALLLTAVPGNFIESKIVAHNASCDLPDSTDLV